MSDIETSGISRAAGNQNHVIVEAPPAPSIKAEREATKIASGNYQRYERVQTHLHYAGLLLFWLAVGSAAILGLIWAWHLAAPDRFRFLSPERQSDLQQMLLAAIGSNAVTRVARNWLDPRHAPRAEEQGDAESSE